MSVNVAPILKEGTKHFSGREDTLDECVKTCKELGAMMETSLGPNGLNKLVVNHIGKTIVSSDVSALLSEIEIMHPAAKMIEQAAQQQDNHCGDGTGVVVLLGGELLKSAGELCRGGLHPSYILNGYEQALEFCLNTLKDHVCWSLPDLSSVDSLKTAIKTCLSSTHVGDEAKLAHLVSEACVQSMQNSSFDPDNLRICKITGGRLKDSSLVNGMVLQCKPLGAIRAKSNCKVAIYSAPIDMAGTETKGTVLLNSAQELLNFSKDDEDQMEVFVKKLYEMGVGVVVCGANVSDIAVHFFDKYDMMIVREYSKFGLKRLCSTTRSTAMVRLATPLQEELGFVETVQASEIASQDILSFSTRDARIVTMVLQGGTSQLLDDLERSITNCLGLVRMLAKGHKDFVGGAGSCEAWLSAQLEEHAKTLPGLEHLAVLAFAEALLAVPKVLCSTSGYSALKVVPSLMSLQRQGIHWAGIDASLVGCNSSTSEAGVLQDIRPEFIMDHAETKYIALKYAMDAVCTVLKIDHIVMSRPAGGPKPQQGPGDNN